MDDTLTLDDITAPAAGTQYVNCSPAEYLAPAGQPSGFRLTLGFQLSGFVVDALNPFTSPTLASELPALESNVQSWTKDAVAPVQPFPVVSDAWLNAGLAVATLAVMTLGNGQYVQVGTLVQAVLDNSRLYIVVCERIPYTDVHGTGTKQALATSNDAATAANAPPSVSDQVQGFVDSLTGAGITAAAVVLILAVIVGLYFLHRSP